MGEQLDQTDVRALFAEARRIAGSRPGGALRLMLMRLRRNRAEDVLVRGAVGRILTLDGDHQPEPAALPGLLERRGYRPLGRNGRVWVHGDPGRRERPAD